jgi:serine/threonine-protein kinase RsbW
VAGDTAVYRLDGFAVPGELDRVHELLERAGSEHPEVGATDLMLFETAVIEIANNVVEHGRPIGEVRWRFVLTIDGQELGADLYDSAEAVNVDLDAGMPGADMEGGRGLPLAGALLDHLSVERSDGGNHWRLVRRLDSAPT